MSTPFPDSPHCFAESSDILGIVAGSGDFPLYFLNQIKRPFFILAFKDITDKKTVEHCPHSWVRLGALGDAIRQLKRKKITELVFLGNFPRPSWGSLLPDWQGIQFLKTLGYHWSGDDFIMRKVKDFLEAQGFSILAPQMLQENLLAPYGCLTKRQPEKEHQEDIQLGIKILETLSWADFGQGVALQNGKVLAIEAAEGTDACIIRAGHLKNVHESGPIYVKRCKIHQSQVMDLPTIGPKTIGSLKEAGFEGMAIEGQKTLIVEKERVQLLADHEFLFLTSL